MVKEKKKRKPIPQKVRDAASKALQGNNFWEIRSKHGRDILFKTPVLLWEAACEYFKWCVDNPIMKAENKVVSVGGNMGSEVELHEEPLKRPFTLDGLCLYLGCGSSYFRNFKNSKAYESNKDFSTVIEAIEKVVFNQQFEGAAVGQFNANIIARALGLVDKQDVTSAGEKIAAPEFKIFNTAPALVDDEKKVDGKKKTK